MTDPSQEGGARANICKRPGGAKGKTLRTRLAAERGPYCGVCTFWIDMRLEGVRSPDAPTLDHIVALADGGTNAWENLQLAHARCNRRKSSEYDRQEREAAAERKHQRIEQHNQRNLAAQAAARERRMLTGRLTRPPKTERAWWQREVNARKEAYNAAHREDGKVPGVGQMPAHRPTWQERVDSMNDAMRG